MAAQAIITIDREGESAKRVVVDRELVAGRGDDCVIRLSDRAVSRRHALFRPESQGLRIERKSEFGPIYLNGQECDSALVQLGDLIEIGPYRIKLSQSQVSDPSRVDESGPQVQKSSLIDAPQSSQSLKTSEASSGDAQGEELGFEQDNRAEVESDSASEIVELGDSPVEGLSLELNPVEGDQFGNAGVDPVSAGDVTAQVELTADDASTKVLNRLDVEARLTITEGGSSESRVFEFKELPESAGGLVAIGRGRECAIILLDKKASRKHAEIRRSGARFWVQDLGSANGTYVNGIRVTERELASDDVITIGQARLEFRATSAEYERRQAGFSPVPEAPPVENTPPEMASVPGFSVDPTPFPNGQSSFSMGNGPVPGFDPALANPGKQSLVQKFRALPPRRRLIYSVVILAALAFLLFDEEPAKKSDPAKKPKAQASSLPLASDGSVVVTKSFEALNADQKSFVQSQYELAFNHFKNREYDRAIDDLGRIFSLVPDYKNAREIERYAREGQRKLKAMEEERKRREEEDLLRARLSQLVDEAEDLMRTKDYGRAQEKFADILSIEPENTRVAAWKREIEAEDEEKRMRNKEKEVTRAVNQRAWEVYRLAEAKQKRGLCHEAIDEAESVADVGASDRRPVQKAKQLIEDCRQTIQGTLDPVLAEAKTHEEGDELVQAFQLYKRATEIDPPHRAGYEGMNRIRGVLNARAKVLYTEAVLAESYSDFVTAKKKYEACLKTAPEDDIYHERAKRRLGYYLNRMPAQSDDEFGEDGEW